MSLAESKLKLSVLHTVGCALDDQLESARAEKHRSEGTIRGLAHCHQKMYALLSHVDEDVDKGELDLGQAALAKRMIVRCLNLVEHHKTLADLQLAATRGAENQGSKSVQVVQTAYETTRAEVARIKALAESSQEEGLDDRASRPPGERPGATLKQRRLAQELAAQPNGASDGTDA